MFQHKGIWLPDGEDHYPMVMDHEKSPIVDGKGTYQYRKFVKALECMRNDDRLVAVDVGASVGFWSIAMSKHFQQVQAFEPAGKILECLRKNLAGIGNVRVNEVALGAEEGEAPLVMWTEGHHGNISIDPDIDDGDGGDFVFEDIDFIPIKTLDSFELENVNFMKVDCEGYELHVLEGAVETLKRCRPTVVVEQKPGWPERHDLPPRGAVEFLQDLGARLYYDLSGDFIMGWKH